MNILAEVGGDGERGTPRASTVCCHSQFADGHYPLPPPLPTGRQSLSPEG